MVVLDGNFALSCGPETDYPSITIFQCMLERTDATMNEVLEPITFVLAYLTVLPGPHFMLYFVAVIVRFTFHSLKMIYRAEVLMV
jgi:hypothetical protein